MYLHALSDSQRHPISHGDVPGDVVSIYPIIPGEIGGDSAAYPLNLVTGIAAAPDVVFQQCIGRQSRRHCVIGDGAIA